MCQTCLYKAITFYVIRLYKYLTERKRILYTDDFAESKSKKRERIKGNNKCYQKLHFKLIVWLIIVRVCSESLFFSFNLSNVFLVSDLSYPLTLSVCNDILSLTYARAKEIVKKINIEIDMISSIFFLSLSILWFTCSAMQMWCCCSLFISYENHVSMFVSKVDACCIRTCICVLSSQITEIEHLCIRYSNIVSC